MAEGGDYNRCDRMTRSRRHPPRPDHQAVLIVEDDAEMRDMMAQLLTLEGFRTATAANGSEALAYLQRGDLPDLILLDLMMPVMDGWEFRRRQQADPALAALPVIVLSALEPVRAADFGDALFLTKPLDFDRLLDLVRQHCS
jgi:CheY-like chemotaxis protein